ncbi:MAG: hypothetical protein PHY30_02550 [Candidatus Pacebacteria bacterium]|nr:hypothetical protein [Candidatus Paceibacterota bacterium]
METLKGRSFLLVRRGNGFFCGLAVAMECAAGSKFYAMETTNVSGTAEEIMERAVSPKNEVSFSKFIFDWKKDESNGSESRIIKEFDVLTKEGEILFSWSDVRFLLN